MNTQNDDTLLYLCFFFNSIQFKEALLAQETANVYIVKACVQFKKDIHKQKNCHFAVKKYV